jgi:quercetin dioxygenase-like cupin family protein
MNKQGKVWGETFEILKTPFFNMHWVHGKKGESLKCTSEHLHKFYNNWFFVTNGKILVRRWRENDLIDETILERGDQTVVPPNEWHQFVVLEDCEAFEVYWPHAPEIDIERRKQGGKYGMA